MLNGIINLSLLKWCVRYISNADNANNTYYYSDVKANGRKVSSGSYIFFYSNLNFYLIWLYVADKTFAGYYSYVYSTGY